MWNLLKDMKRGASLLAADARAARRPPVFIVGFPRSGTSWLASILNTAQSIEYYNEPFNPSYFSELEPHHLTYVPTGAPNQAFAAYCRRAFSGQGSAISVHKTGRRNRFDWWPRRILVKDVHVLLALEWIQQDIRPATLIIIRHPCGVAASWAKLRNQKKEDPYWRDVDPYLQHLLAQPRLMEEYLGPFRKLLEQADQYHEKVGALWGASHHVMLHQQRKHPEWVVTRHEELCADPLAEFQRLFRALNLRWTDQTQKLIGTSTTHHSSKAYTPSRISSGEPDKWRRQLTADQTEQVRRFVRPFELPFCLDF